MERLNCVCLVRIKVKGGEGRAFGWNTAVCKTGIVSVNLQWFVSSNGVVNELLFPGVGFLVRDRLVELHQRLVGSEVQLAISVQVDEQVPKISFKP